MTSSLLQGKRFFCRDWVFSKIVHCLENRSSAKTCGTLIMGGPGCGKTALCCEMVWPTFPYGKQGALSQRILAHYFCQAHDTETLMLSNFVLSLIDQIYKSSLVHGFRELIEDAAIQAVLDPTACERDPDAALRAGVLVPLSSIAPPPENLFVIVDSVDESYQQTRMESEEVSSSIADLLGRHHHLFPQWLLLVCTARKQSKAITRMFTGFRKIGLDDLRKSHVIRDVQQYILSRLDKEDRLRQHLSRETAETLNQLHIKCNGCFLYLEKVLDGVVENFILLREIREIPGTLNGLYLWLCQRIFLGNQFERVLPILNVILAARRPLTEMELYSCMLTRNTTLTFEEFHERMEIVSKILIEGRDGTKILFHHSFAEWLMDIKHCTQKYLCATAEGHAMLALSFTLHAPSLTSLEVQDFALHLAKSNLLPPFELYHLALWILVSGAKVEDSLSSGLLKDESVVKLLLATGAKPPLANTMIAHASNSLLLKSTGSEHGTAKSFDEAVDNEDLDDASQRLLINSTFQVEENTVSKGIPGGGGAEGVDMAGKAGQTTLSLAVRQGNVEAVRNLIESGASVNHVDNDGWTILRSAAWGGHIKIVELLLDAGVQVDQADRDGRTALRAAAWGGHSKIVLRLLERGADVNKVDKEGRTALIAAAYMGHTNIVEDMLDYGADINHEDIDGRTALSVAALCIPASEGHLKVVSLLLDRGAEVNHYDKDAMTPLLVAAYEGHYEVCELLLENDADIDHTDNSCRTALQAAVSMGHGSVVALLLFWGAAVDMIDADGRTVLGIAAQQGNADVVRQLLNRGLDEMHRDNAGWTPLHIAAFEGNKEVVDVLLEAGARVNEVDNEGRIPLVLSAQEGHLSVVNALTDAGSMLDAKSHDGRTALRTAALEGHQDIVHSLLCRKNIDVNYRDADGRSTLYVLALDNRLSMATLLLDHGADIESFDFEGRTPLHVAAWQGHYEMVEVLLSRGANPDAVDNDRRTATQSAAWQGRHEIVRLLVENGATVDHTCNQGATALCIAAQEGHEQVVGVLLQHGANPNHVDQCGRTPFRVASKGGHASVVRLLKEYTGCSTAMNNASCNRHACGPSQASTGPPVAFTLDAKYSNSTSHALANARAIANGHIGSSGSSKEWPSSDQKYAPANAKLSQNLVSLNSLSTTRSSSSSGAESGVGLMSFTQQLQQCSDARRRNRSSNQLLSPVHEPPPVPLLTHSPGSPLSEVHSCKASPAFGSPVYDITGKPAGPQGERAAGQDEMVIEPIWQRQLERSRTRPNRMGAMVMGQTALVMNSPELRRKRNGIITNPGCSPPTADATDGALSSQSSGGSFVNTGSHEHLRAEATKQESATKAARPSGLPLKRETPL